MTGPVRIRNRMGQSRARFTHVHSLTLDALERNQLQLAEYVLDMACSVPLYDTCKSAFVDDEQVEGLNLAAMAGCCDAAVQLDIHLAHGAVDHNIATEFAREFYYEQTQKLLCDHFPPGDPFWAVYDVRIKCRREQHGECNTNQVTGITTLAKYLRKAFGAFFIPLDAMHYLSRRRNPVAYALLCQSVKWLLTADFGPMLNVRCNPSELRRKSLILVKPLELPLLEGYITEKIERG